MAVALLELITGRYMSHPSKLPYTRKKYRINFSVILAPHKNNPNIVWRLNISTGNGDNNGDVWCMLAVARTHCKWYMWHHVALYLYLTVTRQRGAIEQVKPNSRKHF